MQTVIHIAMLPLEFVHLLWTAATGEFGPGAQYGARLGLAWVVIMWLERQSKRAENRRRVKAAREAALQNEPRFREQNKPQTFSDEEIRRRMDAAVAAARQRKGLTPHS
jgi:hypothetical protein